MERLATLLSRAMLVLAGIATVVMLVTIVADVISKSAFNFALPGVDRIVASYLMVAVIFLPLAMLELLEENIAVDVLYHVLPTSIQHLCAMLGHLLTAVFYGLLGWLYAGVAIEAIEIREFVSGAWNVPIWPARMIMPAGLIIGAIVALVKLCLILIDLLGPNPHRDTGHHDGDFQ